MTCSFIANRNTSSFVAGFVQFIQPLQSIPSSDISGFGLGPRSDRTGESSSSEERIKLVINDMIRLLRSRTQLHCVYLATHTDLRRAPHEQI